MTKIRRTKLLARDGGRREARLFIIATEGHETEPQYFATLQRNHIIDRNRVHLEVVRSEGTASSPTHVLARLDAWARKYAWQSDFDQLWLVIDLDHWGAPNHRPGLIEVCQKAHQKGYHVAVSNPCFELWLLLHGTGDLIDDLTNVADCETTSDACAECQRRLRAMWGSYNKAALKPERYPRERVEQAIERARALDSGSGDRWPQTIGSDVYKLADELLRSARHVTPGA